MLFPTCIHPTNRERLLLERLDDGTELHDGDEVTLQWRLDLDHPAHTSADLQPGNSAVALPDVPLAQI
jgi:hypothetical protein